MEDSVIYVGIDVHKDTNSVCMYDRQDNAFFAEAKLDVGTDIMVRNLEKAVKDYGLSGEFLLGYEAGPTGYGLCRGLKKHGYDCVIMAPTTIRKASGNKVKTDRKDARLLSATLASDGYRKVYLPDPSDESTKEFTRTRNTLKGHQKKAKQNLLSFLQEGHRFMWIHMETNTPLSFPGVSFSTRAHRDDWADGAWDVAELITIWVFPIVRYLKNVPF